MSIHKHNLTKIASQENIPYGRLQTRVYRGKAIEEAINDTESITDIKSRVPFSHNHSSGISGVTYCKRTRKWQSQIQHNNKPIYCGRYTSIELAEKAIKDKKQSLLQIIKSKHEI